MRTIAIIKTVGEDGIERIAPAAPLPHDAAAIVCDGQQYTIYEHGDTLPDSQ